MTLSSINGVSARSLIHEIFSPFMSFVTSIPSFK
jgi:hypothetical protein